MQRTDPVLLARLAAYFAEASIWQPIKVMGPATVLVAMGTDGQAEVLTVAADDEVAGALQQCPQHRQWVPRQWFCTGCPQQGAVLRRPSIGPRRRSIVQQGCARKAEKASGEAIVCVVPSDRTLFIRRGIQFRPTKTRLGLPGSRLLRAQSAGTRLSRCCSGIRAGSVGHQPGAALLRPESRRLLPPP